MNGKRVLLLGLIGFISFLSGGWLLQRGAAQSGNVYQKARLFDDVLGFVSDHYVDSLGEAQLYDLAIDGLIKELGDPYSRFLRREDFEDLRESTTGNYGGLGIRIDVRDGWITIIAPIPDTPADRAGLETGDRIVEVDGQGTFGWDSDKAVSQLRGPAGSEVRIRVARPGFPEPLPFTIERAEIHINSVRLAKVLDGDVGYISLVNANVTEKLTEEVVQAVTTLRQQGMRRLVLDLRNNPGGLLNQGVAVADLFLDPGEGIVATRGRGRGSSESYSARRRQRWPGMPIVVLVNGGTASASEIIAGALQDHDRALILGTPTFGKGVVQTVFRISEFQALRLTTARWYTPSGRTIHRVREGPSTVADLANPVDPVRALDSTEIDSTQIFHTAAGRVVIGGGGIRPDLIVRSDTLTDAEREFVQALGANLQAYRDVMTTYALELKGTNGVADRTFRVTSETRRELLRRLIAKEIDLPQQVWDGARNLIDQQFGYEVVRYVFGREAEILRRLNDDVQVQKGVALLLQAATQTDLLARASAEAELTRNP